MTNLRHLAVLFTSALTLVLTACSTTGDFSPGSSLATQFGTADDEIALDVAFSSTGRIYALSEQFGPTYDEEGESGYYENAVLRRYDNNGKLIWARPVVETGSNYYWDNEYGRYDVKSLKTDSQGYSYVLSGYGITDGDCLATYRTWATKVDASGNVIRTYSVGYTGADENFGGYTSSAAIAVDSSGNLYAGAENGNVDIGPCTTTDKTLTISKLSSNGVLQWRRTSTVGAPTSMVVTSSGSLYVAGTKGLARYSTSGNLVWTKAVGPLENVIVSGSNIYTRYRKDIRKFDTNGKQLWLKTQSGLNTLIGQDISGDSSGNFYLSGKYAAGTSNYSPFVRKLNSSGTVLWTKTYGTSAYDDALGIATINGSEIYVTGETQGSLAHTNIGGRDGYLRKLNSSGNLVWTR